MKLRDDITIVKTGRTRHWTVTRPDMPEYPLVIQPMHISSTQLMVLTPANVMLDLGLGARDAKLVARIVLTYTTGWTPAGNPIVTRPSRLPRLHGDTLALVLGRMQRQNAQ